MGTSYYITCLDCKVTRDLDKFYTPAKVTTRAEALALAEALKTFDCFRSALVITFLVEHLEHKCVFYNEHSAIAESLSVFDGLTKEDYNFWEEKDKQ